MRKMKKYFFFAATIVMMVSCTNDTIVGDANNAMTTGEKGAISFGPAYKGMTRADHTGAEAATLLNNNFVVYGFKGDGSTKETVFDHYNVNWVTNTANTTTSNTSDWEYVAQTKHAHASIAAQSIKYWDYSTTQYDFIAWSKGIAKAVYTGTPADDEVLITATTPSTMTSSTGGAYTITGKASELAKVYIADLVTVYRDGSSVGDAAGDYQKEVDIKFRSLSAKVRVALYETVPGYSIQGSSVKFYDADTDTDGTPSSTATLYTKGSDVFNEKGTYTVYYPTTGSTNKDKTDYNKAHISFDAASSGTAKIKELGTLDATNKYVVREVAETASTTDKLYIGRSSSTATYAGDAGANYYTVVIPNETGAVLNLKVDYTLISTDGSGETIDVTGATAQVPAVYATWKSGYAYTYIFKISQNTNGLTDPTIGPAGLYPITFDASVVETEEGVQETITTVADPSITTYAKGTMVTTNNEYLTGSNIYVMVNDGTMITLTAANAKLYTVTLASGAAQTINEASVANAIKNGIYNSTAKTYTVTDANGKDMVVTENSGLSIVTEIAAADAPDGNAITSISAAKFTPAAPTYTAATPTSDPAAEGLYERSGSGTTEDPYVYALSTDATVDSGKTYYGKTTSSAGTYVFEYINGTDKYYKIIKVVD